MKTKLLTLALASLTIGLLGSCKKEDPKVSVTSVTLDQTELTLTVGDPDVKLVATVAPENATDKTVSWSSNTSGVAIVDTEGNVHAVAEGSAVITVTTTDGSKTATCTVTVTVPKQPYVEIEAMYDGSTWTTLKWYKQNLAITESGRKAWKGGNASAVKVPGTNDDVIVGDYFQWAAYAGYCGNATDADKGLLLYTAFTNTGCGDASDAFTFKDGKKFGTENAPYCVSDAYTKYNETDSKTTLDASDDVANIILGDTWRMPTRKEFEAMKKATYWAWDDTDKGYYVYIPLEGDAGKINDEKSAGNTYAKSDAILFFPAASYGRSTFINAAGTDCFCCSSSLYSNKINAYYLYFHSGNVDPKNFKERSRGISVRPVSE